MEQNTAVDFYDRIVQGTDYSKEITLEHKSGAVLEGVVMRPVDKQTLAYVIQQLPDDLFDAIEDADSADEAEELMEEKTGEDVSTAAMNEDTINAFERLCKESLSHDELTTKQIEQIIDELDFATLFELGGQIVDMSFAEGGAIKDFRERE